MLKLDENICFQDLAMSLALAVSVLMTPDLKMYR